MEANEHTDTPEYGIITLAFGSSVYHSMAVTLGRSLRRFTPNAKTAVITDIEHADLRRYYDIVIPVNAGFGSGVSQKLHLDLYSPFQHTVFIDCDCIALKDTHAALRDFVSSGKFAIGTKVFTRSDEGLVNDLGTALSANGLKSIPKFNGGVYYFNQSEQFKTLFETARSLLKNFTTHGFATFRNCGPPDEIVFGVSMEQIGMSLFDDGGRVMRTPIGLDGVLEIDTIIGAAAFKKEGYTVQPAILHYAGAWREHMTYRREAEKLRILDQYSALGSLLASAFSALFDSKNYLEAFARSIFRSLPRPLRLLWHGLANLRKRFGLAF